MSLDQFWIADMRPVHSWNQPLLSAAGVRVQPRQSFGLAGENGSRAIGITAANLPTSNRRINLHSKVVY